MISIGLALGLSNSSEDPIIVNESDDPPPPIVNRRILSPVSDRKPDENGNYKIDDMIMTEEQFKMNYGTEEEKKEYLDRQGIPGSQYRWSNNEIPYQISSQFSSSNVNKIKNAIADFNSRMSGCFTIR